MNENDITNKVQRLEAFEERLSVKIDALAAFESVGIYNRGETEVAVRGELHSEGGSQIDKDIELHMVVYDLEGRVMETTTDFICHESFFGFHVFDIDCVVPDGTVGKIRLFPKES